MAVGTHGMVASSHPLASEAGVATLRRGGNAVDAAIATNAVLAVTQPHLCGLGGDLFYLIYEGATNTVHGYNGSGRSAFAASREALRTRGHRIMPPRGPIPINVPGCIDAWDAALRRFGAMPIAELLGPAIDYAENGFPISHGLVAAMIAGRAVYQDLPMWEANFIPSGRMPRPGERYRQTAMAGSLRRIAKGGRDEFYEGELASLLVAGIRELGGVLAERDFAEHRGNWVAPVSTSYRGHTIYETAPNSQGVAALLALNVLEGIDIESMEWGSADYLHVLVEAKQLAFADRNAYLTDPDFCAFPMELLRDDYAVQRRKRINPRKAGTPPPGGPKGGQGDTTYFAVADGNGNLVSCIQSNYMGFGSGVVIEGIPLQNRGAYFSLDDANVNRLEPHKRTAHTLMAGLACEGNHPRLVFGSMGGDGQPQTHMQIVSNVLDFGMNVQQAIEAPRWMSGRASGADEQEMLHIEDRIPASVRADLAARGHPVKVEPSFTNLMGHAQAIMLGTDGELLGGADPRGDGAAIGF